MKGESLDRPAQIGKNCEKQDDFLEKNLNKLLLDHNTCFLETPEVISLIEKNKFVHYLNAIKNKQKKVISLIFTKTLQKNEFVILSEDEKNQFVETIQLFIEDGDTEMIDFLITANLLPRNAETKSAIFELLYKNFKIRQINWLCDDFYCTKPEKPKFLSKYLDSTYFQIFMLVFELYDFEDEDKYEILKSATELDRLDFVEYLYNSFSYSKNDYNDKIFLIAGECGSVSVAKFLSNKNNYYHLDCSTNQILKYKILSEQEKLHLDFASIKEELESIKKNNSDNNLYDIQKIIGLVNEQDTKLKELTHTVQELTINVKELDKAHKSNTEHIYDLEKKGIETRNQDGYIVSEEWLKNLEYNLQNIIQKIDSDNSERLDKQDRRISDLETIVDRLESRIMNLLSSIKK